MKRLIGKLATLAILLGAVGTGVGLWDIARKSGISKARTYAKIGDFLDEHDLQEKIQKLKLEPRRD